MDKAWLWIVVVVLSLGSVFKVLRDQSQDVRLDKLEAASTVAQQPQERHLLNTKVDSTWSNCRCDTAIVTSNGSTTKMVTCYYSK